MDTVALELTLLWRAICCGFALEDMNEYLKEDCIANVQVNPGSGLSGKRNKNRGKGIIFVGSNPAAFEGHDFSRLTQVTNDSTTRQCKQDRIVRST